MSEQVSDKTALRALLAERRAAAAMDQSDAGAALPGRWPALPVDSRCVAGYVRFRSEIDPAPLMAALAARGARLCLPATPSSPAEGLTFRAYQIGDPLTRSRFGVCEPRPTAAAATPDIILVPLLGFDRRGGRLGYGQGHYDRTLAALRAQRPVVALGLAFAAQEVDALACEPHDQPMDWVLTPEAALLCR